MQGWPPEMQRGGPRCNKPFLLSFIRSADMQKGAPTCRVGRPRCKKKLHLGRPTLHVGPPILLFYCSTISLQIQYCRGRCLGLAARDAKKFSKYYHVLQQNVVFASRTANLACRPSYSIFLLIYYFTFSLHARDAKKRFFISDGQPCMSALLFYCFTNLLLYYLLQIQYCRGRCLGLAARDAKSFPRTTTHHHVLPRTTAERRFASRTANLACRPSYSTVLLIYYCTIYSRYSTAAADVWGWPPEMRKNFPHTTTYYSRT